MGKQREQDGVAFPYTATWATEGTEYVDTLTKQEPYAWTMTSSALDTSNPMVNILGLSVSLRSFGIFFTASAFL